VHSHAVSAVRRDRSLVGLAAVGVLCVAIAAAGTDGPRAQRTAVPVVGPPHFVDETESAGIRHVYDGPFEYAVGGGIVAFDCDGDRKPDLYIAGGSGPAALYRNESPLGGALRFSALHDAATDLTGVLGAYPIDIDGDGLTDLVVLRNGEDVVLRGLGGCRFARANETLGFSAATAATTAFSATWEQGATLPTLALGHYVDAASSDPHRLCVDNELVRPSGGKYARPIALSPGWCALSMLFSDWNRSGHADLRVSNDLHYYLPSDGQEQLWRVAPGAAPTLYTAADGWVAVQVQGMGIASYDLGGAGYPDVFLTSQADNRLQTLVAGTAHPTYRDVGLKRGVNAAQPFTGGDTRPSTGWHAQFEDVNNDGFVDLFIAKGNVGDQEGYAQKDPSDLLLGQSDGTFREVADAAGIVSFARGRGAAIADFNIDGMLDLVEVNYGAPVRIWRNVGAGDGPHPAPTGNWLAVTLSQTRPNVDAIGSWVEVRVGDRVMRREITIGGGHASGQLGWIHFGIGEANVADIRVLWPGGETGPWLHVNANEFVMLRRGTPDALRWSPGRA